MNEALKRLVWDRAQSACEYCRLPQSLDVLPFQTDHIIAEQHHGPTVAENLALSCLNDKRSRASRAAPATDSSRAFSWRATTASLTAVNTRSRTRLLQLHEESARHLIWELVASRELWETAIDRSDSPDLVRGHFSRFNLGRKADPVALAGEVRGSSV